MRYQGLTTPPRRRKKSLAIALAVAPALVALAFVNPAAMATTGGSRVLYSQNVDDEGVGIVSQHFGPRNRVFDSRGADDFTVPAGGWTITEVDVTGKYRNKLRAASESVAFYADTNGHPGKLITKIRAEGTDNDGSLAVPLGDGVTLAAGTYWVSVQVAAYGVFWVWESTTKRHGQPAFWRNPPDGFRTGCVEFAIMKRCSNASDPIGPDFMFALKGSPAGDS